MRQIWLGWLVLAAMAAFVSVWTPAAVYAQAPEEGGEEAAAPAEAAPAAAPAAEDPVDRIVARAKISWTLVAKLVALAVLVWLWASVADWVNRDSQIFSLGHRKWNPIVVFPLAVLLIAAFFIPLSLWIWIPLIAVVYLGVSIPYVLVHNKAVEPHQTVLTGQWWRYIAAQALGAVGVKVDTERKAEYEKGAAVDLLAMGAEDPSADNVNLLTARQSPGYLLVKDLVAEMVDRRGERARLEFTSQAVDVRYQIDGVWHPGAPKDRASGDVMLAVMKTLSNLDVKERRKRQMGKFGAKYEGKSLLMEVVSEGVKTGERVVVTALTEKERPQSYQQLGMREGLQKTWAEIMALDKGLVILSSMPGDGMTTLTNVSIDETDRLMRDFVAIEDVQHREQELQNVNVTTYDSAAGQTPAAVIPELIRTYPNVYVLRDFTDVEAVKLLLDEIVDEHMVITNVHARSGAEALIRLLQQKVPHKQFAQLVTAVMYQRLIRKLCDTCKVGYTPSAEALKKLGIPPGKVSQFFRPPKPEEIESGKPCPDCQGIGYKGRTGVFELLAVTDDMREVLLKQPKVELIKKAARGSGQRSLQEEGILLVAKGVTSLPELQRILKAGA